MRCETASVPNGYLALMHATSSSFYHSHYHSTSAGPEVASDALSAHIVTTMSDASYRRHNRGRSSGGEDSLLGASVSGVPGYTV